MGPKDQDKKLSLPLYYLAVTHRLPVQQGQDYPESDNVCAEVCVRMRVLEGNAKVGRPSNLESEHWGRCLTM